jgi:4-amino-4-deoxy-L-arabinose transferase-like glycosyltransferase
MYTPTAAAVLGPADGDGGQPRIPWKRRTTRPGYELPVLLLIVATAAVLFTWGIGQSVYHVFYASAVRSMTDNPVAFFYGSFDPGNSITLDKLPGFMWPQALSAMLFGFHPWSLVLPQGVEGVGCVRRWAGVVPGLLAAAFLTLTPVTVGLGRSIVEDAPFLLLLLLAAEGTQRAVERDRPRTLLLAGVWVGVAFQCKMVEAWAVLPALAVTYLVASPATLRRRLAHVALAGAVTLTVSLSWIAVAALTPAQDRPYIDGTTNNSALSMVVGYNFLSRFSAVGVNAAATGSVSAVQGGARTVAQTSHPAMGDSVLKMFSPGLASQTGWLYPLAAVGLVWGLAVAWRHRVARTDRALAGYLMWGVWLATFFAAFSFGSVTGHTYYMGVVAVALCALSGAGLARCWQACRSGGRRAWVLPAVTIVNVGWSALLTWNYPRFLPWAAPTAGALCVLALAVLGAARLSVRHRPRIVVAGLVAGLLSILLVPAAWSASALSPRYNTPGSMARVGPTNNRGGGSVRLTASQRRILTYLKAHRGGAKYLAAVPKWGDASAYILSANASILPMGGFTGQVPFPTLGEFRHLIGSGELHYVIVRHTELVTSGRSHSSAAPILRWVESQCTVVRIPHSGALTPRLYHCGVSSASR